MRNELAGIENICKAILSETEGLLSWTWDDYVGTMLAPFNMDDATRVAEVLDESFASKWDFKSITEAPQSIRDIATKIGGIRQTQHLFTSESDQNIMAYGAWWPWGNGETISIRIGIVTQGISQYDAKAFKDEFTSWFTVTA